MGSSVVDPEMAQAFDAVGASLDDLRAVGVSPFDARDAVGVIRELEALGRRMDALQVELVSTIERQGLHQVDGHASAKVMVAHVAKLSSAEAARRARAARALADLPATATAFSEGRIGACQVGQIAQAHANSRVREQLVDRDAACAARAEVHGFRDFAGWLTDWVRRADEDGTCDTNERHHQHRDAKMVQDFSRSAVRRSGGGSRPERPSLWRVESIRAVRLVAGCCDAGDLARLHRQGVPC